MSPGASICLTKPWISTSPPRWRKRHSKQRCRDHRPIRSSRRRQAVSRDASEPRSENCWERTEAGIWGRCCGNSSTGNRAMRLGIVTPFYFPSVRGNSITVQRIESGLRDHGVIVRVWSLEENPSPGDILHTLVAFAPDLVHGFHVSASGRIVTNVASRLEIPSILSVTGTDVNTDLFDPDRRVEVMEVLRRATRVVVFHNVMRAK